MKLLLVLASDKTYENVSLFLRPLGFELIRYRHVQKAMDNIEEIDPAGIIISAKDFPRHWKTMVSFIRHDRPQNECAIVILKGDVFPEDEINKATALNVDGLMLESLEKPEETEKLQAILTRCASGEDKQKSRSGPENWSHMGFVFSHPEDEKIITGTVKNVSSAGISFKPDHPGMVENIEAGTEIQNCSLRMGDGILSPVCTVCGTAEEVITLEFLSFPGTEKETLDVYLENLPLEEPGAK
jgi:hypothetical protein